MSLRNPWTTLRPASMPLFMEMGCAPWNSMALKPLLTSSFEIRVLVVVPSPAYTFVLLATLLSSFAPKSRSRVFSKIDFTTVTPSFVIFGAPNVFWERCLCLSIPKFIKRHWPTCLLLRAWEFLHQFQILFPCLFWDKIYIINFKSWPLLVWMT